MPNNNPTPTQDYHMIKQSSFDSNGKAVLYSGKENAVRMEKYASETGAVPIHKTEGGKKLSTPNRYDAYGETKADTAWKIASAKYVKDAHGDMKTFVAGARPERIHRTTEVPLAVKNSKLKTINGVERSRFEKIFDKTLQESRAKGLDPRKSLNAASDRTFRAFAVTELRQAKKEAYQSADKKQIADYQKRKDAYLNQRIDDRQAAVKRQGVSYTGPQKKTPEQRSLDRKIDTRNMHARASLDKNIREGNVSKQDAPKEKARIEKTLSEYAKSDKSAFQAQETNRAVNQTSGAKTSTRSPITEGASKARSLT
jgi:hypothetical protein